jgi:AraC-like DNA-binding protein
MLIFSENPRGAAETSTTNWFHLSLQGMDAADRLNGVGRFPIRFQQIGPSSIDVGLQGGQSDIFCVWRTESRSGFSTAPSEPADLMTIRFVTNGWLLRRNRRADYVGRPDIGMFIAFEDMDRQTTSGDFQALSGTITRPALARAQMHLQGSDRPHVPALEPVVDIAGDALVAFRHTFSIVNDRLRTGIPENDFAFPLMEEIMIYQLLTAWPRICGPAALLPKDISERQVDLAVDFIEANLTRPLQLADIASAAGISVRSLQTKFKSKLGRTPLQYIYDRRLDGVHEDLRAKALASLSIKQVALRHGFAHASDFNRRYRLRFACTPADTRSKSRVDG